MKQNWFENAIEVIGRLLHDVADMWSNSDNVKEANDVKDVKHLLELASEGYSLVQFPESQKYMEEEWFKEEAILALGDEGKFGKTAYFIPIKYIKI